LEISEWKLVARVLKNFFAVRNLRLAGNASVLAKFRLRELCQREQATTATTRPSVKLNKTTTTDMPAFKESTTQKTSKKKPQGTPDASEAKKKRRKRMGNQLGF